MGVYCALYSWGPFLLCTCLVPLSEAEYGQLRIEYIYIKPYKHTRTPQKGRGFVTIMEDRWQTGDQVVLTNWRLLRLPGLGVWGQQTLQGELHMAEAGRKAVICYIPSDIK